MFKKGETLNLFRTFLQTTSFKNLFTNFTDFVCDFYMDL